MYRKHFGLNSAPFRITPDTQRFYAGAQRGAVLDALQYAIEQGEGIVKLSSEIGSGKTMLCRMLADRLAATVDVVYLANPSLQREDVLRAIALELNLPSSGGRLEVLHILHEYLLMRHAAGRRVVVFVEEAQGMDLQALEEIRLLSNLETREDKLLQLVLFGQPELDAHLARKEVRQLRDRITQSFTLPPLTRADLRDYVRFRLSAAGNQGGDPFTPAAYRLLAWGSKGLIRRIHVLADKALLAAYADSSCQITARHLLRALADSEFAPRWYNPKPVWTLALGVMLITIGAVGHAVVPDIGARSKSASAVGVETVITPTANPAPAVKPSTPTGIVSASSAVAPTETIASFVSRVQATQRWLEADSGARYTIQVMTSLGSALEPVERFLRNPALVAHQEKIRIAPTRVGGNPSWSVLYGSYDTRAAALAALREIPPALRGQQPYLRSITAVKTEAAGEWSPKEQDT